MVPPPPKGAPAAGQEPTLSLFENNSSLNSPGLSCRGAQQRGRSP